MDSESARHGKGNRLPIEFGGKQGRGIMKKAEGECVCNVCCKGREKYKNNQSQPSVCEMPAMFRLL